MQQVFIFRNILFFMDKKKRFDKICRDIKSVKIQGAANVAKAGFRAYKLFPNKKTKDKILSLRPTSIKAISALSRLSAEGIPA